MNAQDRTFPSRRALLSGAASAAAAFPVRAVLQPVALAGADAELLALCGKALASEAENSRLFDLQLAAEAAGDEELEDELFDRQAATVPDQHATLEQIATLPARTAAGSRAKAHVLLAQLLIRLG